MGEQTPAGWYADPNDASNDRYWDGSQWGEVRPRPPAPKGRSPWTVIAIVAAIVVAIIVMAKVGNDNSQRASTSASTSSDVPLTRTESPGASATDDKFFRTVRNEGIPVVTDEDAKLKAIALCAAFRQHPGTSIEEATLGFITRVQKNLTPEQGAFFIGAAVSSYCPEERTW